MASPVPGTVDTSAAGEFGVSDAALGAWVLLGERELGVREPSVGRESTGPGVAEGVGAVEGTVVGVGEVVAGGLLAGGGARGTVGETGTSGVARTMGSVTMAATAHDRPIPAAARSSRRRAAPRRIAS